MTRQTNKSHFERQLRVLVTGASGFVGSSIAKHCEVAGMSVASTGFRENKPRDLRHYVSADITDPESLAELMTGVDCVVHAAGLAHQFRQKKTQPPFTKVNVKGTENVAKTAVRNGVKHFILISSVSVYGSHGEIVCNEEEKCDPTDPYAQSKFEAEQRGSEILSESGVEMTILRLATVYGEGDPGNLARLIRTIDRGRFVWIGNGENRKSLIHKDDVARACLAVIQSKAKKSGVYNVVGTVNTMREVVTVIASALGKDLPRWRISPKFAKTMALSFDRISPITIRYGRFERTVTKWLDDDLYDGGKLSRQFGFVPAILLPEGLKREVEWYRTEK